MKGSRPANPLIAPITAGQLSALEQDAADDAREHSALLELSGMLASDPRGTLQRGTQIALELCHAGSAGLSVLRAGDPPDGDFVWESVSGELAAHEGDGTPRTFSPCGLCVDTGTPILLSRPEKQFTYLMRVRPTIFETLIVPLYDATGIALGALWAVKHDPVARFGIRDVDLLEHLRTPMVLALTSLH